MMWAIFAVHAADGMLHAESLTLHQQNACTPGDSRLESSGCQGEDLSMYGQKTLQPVSMHTHQTVSALLPSQLKAAKL